MIEIKLEDLLWEKRMRVSELARQSGVSRTTIYHMMGGDATGVYLETIAALCEALNCDVGDLITMVKPKGHEIVWETSKSNDN